jgi:hypothetical protein
MFVTILKQIFPILLVEKKSFFLDRDRLFYHSKGYISETVLTETAYAGSYFLFGSVELYGYENITQRNVDTYLWTPCIYVTHLFHEILHPDYEHQQV